MTLLILFVALQAADAWTTCAGIQAGAREANPVMARLIDRLGLPPALALAKLPLVALVGGLRLAGHLPVWLLAALCAGYAAVVARNWRVIDRIH